MKRAIEFSVIVCLVSWLFGGIIYFITGGTTASLLYQLLGALYMLIPMGTAMVLQKVKYKEKFRSTGLLRFRVNKFWFIAWLLIPVMVAASIALSALVPGVTFAPRMEGAFSLVPADQAQVMLEQMNQFPLWLFYLMIIVSSLIAGATINTAFAFGEEYGWKNYLVSVLRKYKFATVCLFSGFVWGLWHLPLILMGHNYPSNPILGVPMMILFGIFFTFPMLYFTLKTRSVIVAAIMHGTINALAGMAVFMLIGGNTFTTGLFGWPGFAVAVITTLVLFLYDKYVSKDNIFTNTIEHTMGYAEPAEKVNENI